MSSGFLSLSLNTNIGIRPVGNWSGAVNGMQNSLWCSQVGNRCTTDVQIMQDSSSCAGNSNNDEQKNNKSGHMSTASIVLASVFSVVGAGLIITAVVVIIVVRRRRQAAAQRAQMGEELVQPML